MKRKKQEKEEVEKEEEEEKAETSIKSVEHGLEFLPAIIFERKGVSFHKGVI